MAARALSYHPELGRYGTAATFPLKVHSSGRYLTRANGTPFLLRGDTPWELVTRPSSEMVTYLDDIASRGFTAIIAECPVSPNFVATNYAGNPAFDANLGGGQVDLTAPNSQWFGNFTTLLGLAAARGIAVVGFPLYAGFSGTSEGFYQHLSANGNTRITTYGAYFGGLVQAYDNLIVALGGDYADGDATTLGYYKTLATAIKGADRSGRIYTWHCQPNVQTYELDSITAGYRASVTSTWAGWEYSYEASFGNEFTHANAANNYGSSPTTPFFLGEAHYIGSSAASGDSKLLRRQSWGAMLGGACGTFIGNDTQYGGKPFYSFGTGWQSGLGVTAIQHEAVMHAFLAARAWQLLVPSTGSGLVSSGGGTSNTSGYKPRALASDGSWGAVHVTDGSATTLAFSGFAGTKTVKWFDPTNASLSTVGTHANSGTQSYTPSGNNAAGDADWVLVIE